MLDWKDRIKKAKLVQSDLAKRFYVEEKTFREYLYGTKTMPLWLKQELQKILYEDENVKK